jgi:serine/threonine protein kinase
MSIFKYKTYKGYNYSDCINNFNKDILEIDKQINEGSDSHIYSLKNDNTKIIKVINLNEYYKYNTLSTELEVNNLLINENVSPKIYDVWKCLEKDKNKDTRSFLNQPLIGILKFDKMDKNLLSVSNESKINTNSLLNKIHIIHKKDIAHMDIKLDNIMLKGNEIYIIDYGIALIYNTKVSNQLFLLQNNYLYKVFKHIKKEEAFAYDYILLIIAMYFIFSPEKLQSFTLDVISNMKKENILEIDIINSKKISSFVYNELKEYSTLKLYNKFVKHTIFIYDLTPNKQKEYLNEKITHSNHIIPIIRIT